MTCPSCGGDHLGAALTERGLLSKCQSCGALFAQAEPAEEAPEAPRAQVTQPKSQPRKPAPMSPRDLLREAKAELKRLDAEIARLQKLQTKRDELKRLLDAAKAKPTAPQNIRALRTTG